MTAPTAGQAAREARQHAILDGASETVAMEHAAQAAIDWWHAERDLEPPREITAGRDESVQSVARAALEAEVRRIVDERCAFTGPCEFCEAEVAALMKLADAAITAGQQS